MKKEDLIKKLQELPDGIEVCLFDWRKNLGDDHGDGSYEGIVSDFEVEHQKLDKDDAEHWEIANGKKYISWASLSFNNDDYNDSGSKLD